MCILNLLSKRFLLYAYTVILRICKNYLLFVNSSDSQLSLRNSWNKENKIFIRRLVSPTNNVLFLRDYWCKHWKKTFGRLHRLCLQLIVHFIYLVCPREATSLCVWQIIEEVIVLISSGVRGGVRVGSLPPLYISTRNFTNLILFHLPLTLTFRLCTCQKDWQVKHIQNICFCNGIYSLQTKRDMKFNVILF